MSGTIVIVIGLSKYALGEKLFLPAAQSDAVHFARSMRNWGVPESQIFLLLNSEATAENVESLFNRLSFIEKKTAIFYFCGHGFRSPDIPPKSYLLFYDSSIEKGVYRNSFSVDEIISKMSKLNFVESYVLMDSCYLRVNTFLNPRLEDEISGKKVSKKGLFCLFSSGIEESFETRHYGYFTDCLLKSLAAIDQSKCHLSQLVHSINLQMEANQLPLPESINIGCEALEFKWFLSSNHKEDSRIYRGKIISQIQDALICNREKVICLYGDRGIGKTMLCQSLASKKLKTLYLSLPDCLEDVADPFDYLVHSLLGMAHFQQFDEEYPYYLIIIDNFEKLNSFQINSFIQKTAQFRSQFIVVSNQPIINLVFPHLKYLIYQIIIPPFSLQEGIAFARFLRPKLSEEESEIIYKLAAGNPLKMKKITLLPSAQKDIHFKAKLVKTLSAIYSCGCYINETLFIEMFQLEEKTLRYLKEIGLLHSSKGSVFPDPLISMLVEDENIPLNPTKAIDYFISQLEQLPDCREVAKSLIINSICFNYEARVDLYLKSSFLLLFPNDKSLLLDAVGIFLSIPDLTDASLTLAQMLIYLGEWKQSQILLKKETRSKSLSFQVQFCKMQIFEYTGCFQESILLASQLITKAKDCRLILHRGITYFTMGDWENANADFTFVYENAKDKFCQGRSLCMLSTIQGIRGIDLKVAKKQIEIGIQYLTQINDLAGMWAGWNNLGEILWKSGEYSSSAFYLEKAFEIAKTLNNENMRLETLRNFIHLYLRSKGPFSFELDKKFGQIENCYLETLAYFGKIQIFNTLSTFYLFRDNHKDAIQFLKKAIPLTQKNCEYHIYTLSNLSILAMKLGMNNKSKLIFDKALKLAEKRNNYLAIHQIKNDQALCLALFG